MPTRTPLSLDRPAIHVDVAPGGEIVLRGSFYSTHDGAVLDAATTTWPPEAPGGASVDARGLIDFESGGFHVTSRDPVRHEVHAIATGSGGEACSTLQVAAPCLPLRVWQEAHKRTMSMGDWRATLKGGIELETVAPPVYAPPPAAVPYLQVAGGVMAVGLVGAFLLSYRKRRARSPAGRLLALTKRVRKKLGRADAVVAAPLAPAVETALKALRERRIDAGSTEGQRVIAVLERVDARLDHSMVQARAQEEREAADELVREFESALEAADEAKATR